MSDRRAEHRVNFNKMRLIDIISRLGLGFASRLFLDAGDIASYPGSGGKWLDEGGGGYDFFQGTTTAVQATDPTFNGTPGNLSANEFWSFDGGDHFRYDVAQESWMHALHKNSALWTMIAVIRPGPFTDNQNIVANCGTASTSGPGLMWFIGGGGTLNLRITTGASGGENDFFSSLTVSNTDWNFVATSVDEANNSCLHFVNGNAQQMACTLVSPSAANNPNTFNIGSNQTPADFFTNGGRIAMIAAWQAVALNRGELTALFNAIRGRYGI